MAGAHIEREARYAQTRLSPAQRDGLIVELRAKGWTQSRIAAYVGMTQPAIKYALDRLAGIPRRKPVPLDLCDACWEEVRVTDLNADGLCPSCQ